MLLTHGRLRILEALLEVLIAVAPIVNGRRDGEGVIVRQPGEEGESLEVSDLAEPRNKGVGVKIKVLLDQIIGLELIVNNSLSFPLQ